MPTGKRTKRALLLSLAYLTRIVLRNCPMWLCCLCFQRAGNGIVEKEKNSVDTEYLLPLEAPLWLFWEASVSWGGGLGFGF